LQENLRKTVDSEAKEEYLIAALHQSTGWSSEPAMSISRYVGGAARRRDTDFTT
jgi:hypothetical protein